MNRVWMVSIVCALVAGPATASTLFSDDFETGIDPNTWEVVPGTNNNILIGDNAHAFGSGAAKQVNADPAIYYMRNKAGAWTPVNPIPAGQKLVASVMFWDDNVRPADVAATPIGGTIMLMNSGVGELFQLGVNGAQSVTNYYYRSLALGNKVSSMERTQGWHKLTIEAYPYTGGDEDVKYFIDDTLIGTSPRRVGGGSGVDINEIRLGISIKSPGSAFWYDDVSVSMIPEPATLALLVIGGLGLLRRRPV